MDPLAQLKDIHLPEQVHSWPVAIGWWLLVIILIAVVFAGIIKLRSHRKKHAVRLQVSKQLTRNDNLTTEQILSLLKWTCMHYFDRQEVASIHGSTLLTFLAEKLSAENQQTFIDQAEHAITQCYRKSENDLYVEEFQQAAIYWLENARLFPRADAPKGGKA